MECKNSTQRQAVYARHCRRLQTYLAGLEQVNNRFFWLRLSALIGGGLAVLLAVFLGPPRLGWPVLIAAILVFAVVAALHRRVDRATVKARLALAWAEAQIARSERRWPAIPLPPVPVRLGERGMPGREHPFAPDLDILGERSLHHLLDTALSEGGSRRLAGWLLAPLPDPAGIASRQALVGELVPLNGFRSRLALNGGLVMKSPGERWNGEALLRWLEGQEEGKNLRPILLALSALAVVNGGLFLASVLAGLPPFYVLTLCLYAFIYYTQYRLLEDLFGQAYQLGKSLGQFRQILLFLEKYPYLPGSRLRRLCAPFCDASPSPSRLLGSLGRIASAASLQGNPVIWLALNAAVPWDLYFAYRLNQARQALRMLLPAWLEAWYELEAAGSLANYAHLNPTAVFPVVVGGEGVRQMGRGVMNDEGGEGVRQMGRGVMNHAPTGLDGGNVGASFDDALGGAWLTAEGLGHPLIPNEQRVCNDITFSRLGEIALITGSNMSGKSTFLRTLGVNLVLAYAGGPVCASGFHVAPMRLFTCINVSDSLGDGISYFYAEVRRLKALLDAFESPTPYPLFFLIDEIFRGTNNRERQAGSRAYVQALAQRRGLGAISTHDLELVHLESDLPGLRNYHFREEVQSDRLVFDYRLRPGPSPTTNALAIMRIEGLPVP